MRDGSRSLSAKVKSLEEKNSELADAIAAPRSKMSDAQPRCVYIFWSFICVIFSQRIAKLRLEIQQATDDLHGRGYVFPTSTGRTERMFECYCIFPFKFHINFYDDQEELNVCFNADYCIFPFRSHINFYDKGRLKKARNDAAAEHDGPTISTYFTADPGMVKRLPLVDDEAHAVHAEDPDDLLNIELLNIEADDSDSDEGDAVDAAVDVPTVDAANAPGASGQTVINWSSPTQVDKVRFEKAADALEKMYFNSSKPSEMGCKYDVRRAMATSMFFSKLSNDGANVGVAAKEVAHTFYRKNNTIWRQRAIVKWAKGFITEGRLPPQQQGKHIKVVSLIADPLISKQATTFFKSLKDGERTAEKFRSWVNDTLLPGFGDGRKFKDGTAKPNVSITTCRAWLHVLGWIYGSHKKDVYVDGNFISTEQNPHVDTCMSYTIWINL